VLLEDQIGHWPQIENPDAVLAHFLEFIDRLEGAPRLGRATAAGDEPGDPAR
jgi:hypothetical protein